jgi:hypothetical protein
MLTLLNKLGRTAAWLAGSLRERSTVPVSSSSKEETPRKGVRVRTSVHDGRKYVDSDERIKSDKAGKQIQKLRQRLKDYS